MPEINKKETIYLSEIRKILILGPTTLTVESGAFTISSTIGTVGYPNNKICKLLVDYVRISIYVIVMGIIKCGVKILLF